MRPGALRTELLCRRGVPSPARHRPAPGAAAAATAWASPGALGLRGQDDVDVRRRPGPERRYVRGVLWRASRQAFPSRLQRRELCAVLPHRHLPPWAAAAEALPGWHHLSGLRRARVQLSATTPLTHSCLSGTFEYLIDCKGTGCPSPSRCQRQRRLRPNPYSLGFIWMSHPVRVRVFNGKKPGLASSQIQHIVVKMTHEGHCLFNCYGTDRDP